MASDGASTRAIDLDAEPLKGGRAGGSTAGVLLGLAGLVRALQALAAALDRGDELRQVDLDGVEDLGGVALGAQADLPLARSGVLMISSAARSAWRMS